MRSVFPVLRYSPKGGYGFLLGPDGKDVMIHGKYFPKNLNVVLPGWRVDCEVEESPKGLRVTKIYRILPNEIVNEER
jgi:cold shock CspA family protein